MSNARDSGAAMLPHPLSQFERVHVPQSAPPVDVVVGVSTGPNRPCPLQRAGLRKLRYGDQSLAYFGV